MNTYEHDEKPKRCIAYTVLRRDPPYFESTYDRAEALALGREHRATVTEHRLRLDRWGAFYDTISKTEIMTDGKSVKPSLDDWGAGA